MGWYFRKSVNFGFGRVNFSKSGISYSFGPRGAKINTGPRGTFVSFSHNGIYYRKKISGAGAGSSNQVRPYEEPENQIHTITSAAIDQLTDIDSSEFIDELTAKSKKISYLRWFGVPSAILFVISFCYYFSQPSRIDTHTDYYVTATSATPVNIRINPNKSSAVFGKTTPGAKYDLLDSSNSVWFKVRYADSAAYVSKSFSRIDSVTHIISTLSNFETDTRDLISVSIIGTLFFIYLCSVLHKRDKARLLVEMHYEMDDKVQLVYNKFLHHFGDVQLSSRIWQYLHSQKTYDYKHNAGANNLINRTPILRIDPDRKPARFFRTNIKVPNIKLRKTDLYFFPERLVIKRQDHFAAVFYKHLEISGKTTRFIEERRVPPDSQVVDYTWKFLNKNGGPDRRFNNNRKLPICLYSEYTISSDTGIYEVLTTSKQGAFDNFAHFIKTIGSFQAIVGGKY